MSTVTDNHTMHGTSYGGGIASTNGQIDLKQLHSRRQHQFQNSTICYPPAGLPTLNYSLLGDNDGTGLAEAQSPDANGNLVW